MRPETISSTCRSCEEWRGLSRRNAPGRGSYPTKKFVAFGQPNYGALVKMLLLTAQRHGEVAHMSYKEITDDGIWIIPAERYKTKRPHSVPLSKVALALIAAQQKFNDCDYVFPSSAKKPFFRSGRCKTLFDNAVLKTMQKGAKVEPIPNWTLHDLRRTA